MHFFYLVVHLRGTSLIFENVVGLYVSEHPGERYRAGRFASRFWTCWPYALYNSKICAFIKLKKNQMYRLYVY